MEARPWEVATEASRVGPSERRQDECVIVRLLLPEKPVDGLATAAPFADVNVGVQRPMARRSFCNALIAAAAVECALRRRKCVRHWLLLAGLCDLMDFPLLREPARNVNAAYHSACIRYQRRLIFRLMAEQPDIIERISSIRGLGARIARACRIKPAAVYQWRRVPATRVMIVSDLTGMSPHAIRPDIFPPPRSNRNGKTLQGKRRSHVVR